MELKEFMEEIKTIIEKHDKELIKETKDNMVTEIAAWIKKNPTLNFATEFKKLIN